MGILDFLFGKKLEIEFTDGDGKTVKRSVTKEELDKLIDKGLAVHGGAITVHVLDPMSATILKSGRSERMSSLI